MRALFAVLVVLDRSEGRAFGDRAVNPRALILVREGFNVQELQAALRMCRDDAEREFMWAVGCIDHEARLQARREKDRARYPRRGRGRFARVTAL